MTESEVPTQSDAESEQLAEGPATTWTPETIIAQIEACEGKHPHEAVEAALANPDAVIPALIDVVAAVNTDPDGHPYQAAHVYALLLLGHLRAVEAHQTLLAIGSLTQEQNWSNYDDLITEHLPTALLNTCGGDLRGLKELARNRQADPFVRGSAIQAMCFAVGTGIAQREDVLVFCAERLAEGTSDNTERLFLGLLLGEAIELYPESILPDIERALQQDLIEEGFRDPDFVQAQIALGPEAAAAKLSARISDYALDDIHAVLQSYSWLTAPIPDLDELLSASMRVDARAELRRLSQASRMEKAKKKKKRKQANASRKRNRRK